MCFFGGRENGCDKDEECGFNEYCTTLLAGYVSGQCRTKLANGSLCVRSVLELFQVTLSFEQDKLTR